MDCYLIYGYHIGEVQSKTLVHLKCNVNQLLHKPYIKLKLWD